MRGREQGDGGGLFRETTGRKEERKRIGDGGE